MPISASLKNWLNVKQIHETIFLMMAFRNKTHPENIRGKELEDSKEGDKKIITIGAATFSTFCDQPISKISL